MAPSSHSLPYLLTFGDGYSCFVFIKDGYEQKKIQEVALFFMSESGGHCSVLRSIYLTEQLKNTLWT